MRPATEPQPEGGSVENSGAWLPFSFEFQVSSFETSGAIDVCVNNVLFGRAGAKARFLFKLTPGFTRKAGSVMAKSHALPSGGSHRRGSHRAPSNPIHETSLGYQCVPYSCTPQNSWASL